MKVFEKLRKQELLRKICTLELNITLGEGTHWKASLCSEGCWVPAEHTGPSTYVTALVLQWPLQPIYHICYHSWFPTMQMLWYQFSVQNPSETFQCSTEIKSTRATLRSIHDLTTTSFPDYLHWGTNHSVHSETLPKSAKPSQTTMPLTWFCSAWNAFSSPHPYASTYSFLWLWLIHCPQKESIHPPKCSNNSRHLPLFQQQPPPHSNFSMKCLSPPLDCAIHIFFSQVLITVGWLMKHA